jgi:hypothetical protein
MTSKLGRERAGFVVPNSETGNGSFKISPQLIVEICNNGMTLTEHVLKEVHLLPRGRSLVRLHRAGSGRCRG